MKCPDCGGRGWIIIERGGLSGAERCSCSKPPVVPGADDPPEFPDFMEAAIHISMTVRRFPKKDAKLLDIVARQLERFVSTKDQLEWVKEAAGMEMESWHLGELRRIFCQQFEPKDKIYFNDSPEKAEMRGIEAAGEVYRKMIEAAKAEQPKALASPIIESPEQAGAAPATESNELVSAALSTDLGREDPILADMKERARRNWHRPLPVSIESIQPLSFGEPLGKEYEKKVMGETDTQRTEFDRDLEIEQLRLKLGLVPDDPRIGKRR